jgi:hypothetical protein
MGSISLRRTGKAALTFDGRKLATASEKETGDYSQYWLELDLYRSTARDFVLSTRIRFIKNRERNKDTTRRFNTASELVHFLKNQCAGIEHLVETLLERASAIDNELGRARTHVPEPDRVAA